MPITEPDLPDGDPQAIVYNLVVDEWVAANVPDHYQSPDWTHTGWYTGNPNPEISVVFDRERTDSPTGYDGIAGSGGPTRRPDGTVHVDVWVPGDRDDTGGMNPKKYAWQLRREVERIATLYPEGPPGEDMTWMGKGIVRRVPEPDETDVEHRHRIPFEYGRYEGRQ